MNLPTSAEMTERLRTWIERYRVAGASVAWMHDGTIETAAAGVININTGVETTPDALFQIGSITKVYTTTLIMQLVDEGRLDLDAPATKYLPDLRFGDAPSAPLITLRHLPTHTSGVDGDFFDDFGRGDDCVEKYVAACASLPQVFAPGAMFSYCNAGFVVLGRIIEGITGMPWHAALKQRIIDPLALKQTVTLPEDALLHRTAAGHAFNAKIEMERTRYWSLPRATGPAGATLCSTVSDLLALAKMHIDGGVTADGARILSDASVRAMQQSQFDLPAVPGEGAAHWGLGWMLFDWGGRRVIGHDGGTIGQMSSLRILPDEHFAVAVLTNTTPSGALLTSRILRWLFGEAGIELPERPKPPETPPDIDVRPYAGVYERLGLRTELTVDDAGRLNARYISTGALSDLAAALPPEPLFPLTESVFLGRQPYTGAFVPITFSDFKDGRPAYLHATRVSRRSE